MDRDLLITQRAKPLVLLLGSNIGHREEYLENAVKALTLAFGEPQAISDLYETEPWGYTDQNAFINQAVVYDTSQEPMVLLETVLRIEQEIGRKREIKWGPRVIDIDVIFYGNLVYKSDVLEIPHPYMQDRLFVLDPLTQIVPEFEHPVLEKSILELRDHLKAKEENEG